MTKQATKRSYITAARLLARWAWPMVSIGLTAVLLFQLARTRTLDLSEHTAYESQPLAGESSLNDSQLMQAKTVFAEDVLRPRLQSHLEATGDRELVASWQPYLANLLLPFDDPNRYVFIAQVSPESPYKLALVVNEGHLVILWNYRLATREWSELPPEIQSMETEAFWIMLEGFQQAGKVESPSGAGPDG